MNTSSSPPGKLIIVSGPSGAGKSTVVKTLLKTCSLPLELSVSATTRAPRAGEIDGRDYFFLSQAEFARKRLTGDFLECKEVFGRGDWYGTLRNVVSTGLERGKWLILEIDVQGALAILERDNSPITIFVHPGSMQELEDRLRSRGTEDEAAIQRRLEVAAEEMAQRHHYRHQVVNRDLEVAVQEICSLLESYSSPSVRDHK
jgi:guanylate kinase